GGDARQRARRLRVDRHDPRVGVGRAEERRVEHPRELHVVDVARLAPQEARILSPLDRRAEIFRAHQVLNSSPARDYIPRVGLGPGGQRALGSTGGLGYSPCQPSPSRRRRPMVTRWIVLVALVLAAIAPTAGPPQSQPLINSAGSEP